MVAGVAVVVFAALLHRCLGIAARADDDGSDAVVIRLLDDFPGRFDVRLFAERSNRDTRLQLHRRIRSGAAWGRNRRGRRDAFVKRSSSVEHQLTSFVPRKGNK